MKRERPTTAAPRDTAAPRRIIEKEKVLTNMQAHLKHIQELEAERAAKHQEKRDKAKQKVEAKKQEMQARISASRGLLRWKRRRRDSPPSHEAGGGLGFEFEPCRVTRSRRCDLHGSRR